MSPRYPAFAPDILAHLRERGAPPVELPVIQPADPFLDMAGEDLRRRVFLTESESGEALCLRPEFTIPVCRDHIESRAATPRRYGYLGEVFRQRREGGNEFYQAGIEDLGDADIAAADARSLADAHGLLERLLPAARLEVTLGDQAMFEAVLAALGLPPGWQTKLTRAFGSPDKLADALAELADPPAAAPLPRPVARLVAAGDEAALTAHVGEAMEEAGLSPSAGRTPQEIAQRLIERAQLASLRIADGALAALQTYLAIRAPLDRAADALAAFADEAGLVLDDAIAAFAGRAAAIAGHGLPDGAMAFDAAFGRPLDYYTGFVFEIALPDGADGAARPLAGGGRYDRLLTLLGAPQPIPGVGFSVWLDRVERHWERPR